MSLPIAVYREGAFSHFMKLKRAHRKVEQGSFRWRAADCREIEEIPQRARRRVGFFEPLPSAQFHWQPKMSGNFLVMQARWRRTA